MAHTVKQWTCETLGSIDNLKLKTFQKDFVLNDDDVLIEVHNIGFNFADVFSVLGLYESAPKSNLVPGLEFSGLVLQVGKSVQQFKAGDKVLGVARFGAYSTHIVLHQNYVKPVPQDWTLEQGAAFIVQALTAFYGLVELGNLAKLSKRKTATVLVHSAAGGVGLLSLQILLRYKANIIATVGTADKVKLLVEHGVPEDQVIVRTTAAEFPEQLSKALSKVQEKTKQQSEVRLDIIFDSLGGDYLLHGYNKLAAGGRLVVFGSGTFMPTSSSLGIVNYMSLGYKFLNRPTIDPMKLSAENKAVFGFNLLWLYEQVDYMNDLVAEMLQEVQWKAPVVGKRFKFEQCVEAMKYFQSGKSTGKVVLNVK